MKNFRCIYLPTDFGNSKAEAGNLPSDDDAKQIDAIMEVGYELKSTVAVYVDGKLHGVQFYFQRMK